MILHIGDGKFTTVDDIVGIFNLDGEVTSDETKRFLQESEKRGEVETVKKELPKSFILISEKKNKEKVILSHISSLSLVQRINSRKQKEIRRKKKIKGVY